jgi:hypothetical protein
MRLCVSPPSYRVCHVFLKLVWHHEATLVLHRHC